MCAGPGARPGPRFDQTEGAAFNGNPWAARIVFCLGLRMMVADLDAVDARQVEGTNAAC